MIFINVHALVLVIIVNILKITIKFSHNILFLLQSTYLSESQKISNQIEESEDFGNECLLTPERVLTFSFVGSTHLHRSLGICLSGAEEY